MIKIINLFLLMVFLSSCSVGKFIPDDQILVVRQDIELVNPVGVVNPNKLKLKLQEGVTQKSQYGIGKLGLWIYYKTKTDKEKGLKYWLNNKFGKAPVYYDQEVVDRNNLVMERILFEDGYFGSTVSIDSIRDKYFINIEYNLTSKGRYSINKINYPIDTLAFANLFQKSEKRSKLRGGQWYRKSNIDLERERLFDEVGYKGYLDFERDDIVFYVDTLVGDRKVDLFVEIRNLADSVSMKQYHLGETLVYSDYALDNGDRQKPDTIERANFKIVENVNILRPRVLEKIITAEKGSVIDSRDQFTSLNKLQNLGVFKFSNIQVEKRIKGDSAFVDRKLYLTPALTQDIVGEIELNNRIGGFFGSQGVISYSHRNLFRGAERFNFSVGGGVETQIGNNIQFTNTIDFNVGASLRIPRIVSPIKFVRNDISNTQTLISLDNNLQFRSEFYNINAVSASVNYEWSGTKQSKHSLTPIKANVVDLLKTTAAFDSVRLINTRLNNSFQDVFILGSEYSYTYNSQSNNEKQPYVYGRIKLVSAGNLLSLINGGKAKGGEPSTVINLPFAQYIKVSPELRYYIPTSNGLWASRITLGVGVPYGNSDVLPYIEQYFVGGANSLRAFRLRRLGPGAYINPNEGDDNAFIDQTGDIKLELNVEYRFDLFSFFKGAFFVDAGNIWLLDSEDRPEGVFDFKSFGKQIAVGAGFGVRMDFDFFVIRIDAAIPLRKPFSDGFGWTFRDIDLGSKAWRKENLIINLGIGYPF